MDENKGPLSGKPPTEIQGPRRRAPRYYIGKMVGRHAAVYPDTEYNANGSLPGIRNKAARRVVRAAFKKSHSRVETQIRNARALKAQAFEVARENKKSTRFARRLLDKELAIHQPVYVPSQKELRAMRTAARKAKRKGQSTGVVEDAISAVVDRIGKQP